MYMIMRVFFFLHCFIVLLCFVSAHKCVDHLNMLQYVAFSTEDSVDVTRSLFCLFPVLTLIDYILCQPHPKRKRIVFFRTTTLLINKTKIKCNTTISTPPNKFRISVSLFKRQWACFVRRRSTILKARGTGLILKGAKGSDRDSSSPDFTLARRKDAASKHSSAAQSVRPERHRSLDTPNSLPQHSPRNRNIYPALCDLVSTVRGLSRRLSAANKTVEAFSQPLAVSR